LLHIVFDFQNNYGVHPFWPLDDRWYYGDTLFIVEPLLWAVALPAVALLARSRVWVLVAALVFAGGLGYGARSGAVQPPLFAGLVVVAAVVTLVLRGRSRRGRVAFGLFAWTAVMLTFAVSSHAVDRVVRDVTAVRFPDTKILDVVRTPSPGNPLCWSVISIGRESERYVARVASVSLVPAWVDPAHCAPRSRGGTAPLVAIEATDGGVSWRGEFARPTSDLKALSAAHCDAAAFLRYSRAPFWTDDTPPVIGDLRFDRSRALEFAEFPLSRDGACPPNVPPWEPPRRDLLGTR
jgi:inner membrane protein